METTNEKESLTQEWFYASDGNRIGPIDLQVIKSKYKQGIINNETLVWKNGFSDWKKVHETEIYEQPEIPMPPPLIGKAVNNTFVWLLALVPLIGAIVLAFYKTNQTESSYFGELIFFVILNSLFSVIDESKLRKAGYEAHNIFWAVILVPVYLWKRSNITKQSKSYFWVWFIALFISAAIDATRTGSFNTEIDSANYQYEQFDYQSNEATSSNQDKNYSAEDQEVIEKIKAKVKRDFPSDYSIQKMIFDQGVEDYFYMKSVTDNEIKRKIEREFPYDYSIQRMLYNQEVESKEQMK